MKLIIESLAFASSSDTSTNLWTLLRSVDSDQIKMLASEHMWLALVLCFASGILTSFTPCVYPMIPITINIFGRLSQHNGSKNKSFNIHTFFLAGIYVLGMCTTYSLMGLVAGMTGSLFGKLLQSSYMLGFLTILFLTLALSQLGLFKLALPSAIQTRLSRVGNSESRFGIFLMGLISGLIVSPCVGPVIAGILAFVFDTSNALRGFFYFLSFSLGLGMLFLLIGGFSGLITTLPRSGNWMTRINRVLAGLMLIAAGYYGMLWIKNLTPKTVEAPSTSSLQWMTDENAALKLAQEKHLPVVVDFTAEWCEACHVLEKTVLSNPTVTPTLSEYVLLRIDVTDDTPENEAKRKRFGVMSLPTILFMSRDGKIVENPQVHGVISADEFLKFLKVL